MVGREDLWQSYQHKVHSADGVTFHSITLLLSAPFYTAKPGDTARLIFTIPALISAHLTEVSELEDH